MKVFTSSGLLARALAFKRRCDEARADRVDAHTFLAEFGGERLGEAEHAVLGGGVGRRTRRAHMHEGLDRADIDDASLAGAQRREESVRHVENAGEVDRDDVFPVVDHGLCRTQHAVAADDAGIVDEDRDLPDLVGDLLRHRDAVLAPGDVERKAFGLAAGIADFLRGLRRRLLVPVEQHDARALAGIAERDGAPDAGACTGDDGDLILEKGHEAFPLLLVLAEDSKRAR